MNIEPNLPQHIPAPVTLDVKQFIMTTLKGIIDDYETAYPCDRFDADNAHSSLITINGRAQTLMAFLNALS